MESFLYVHKNPTATGQAQGNDECLGSGVLSSFSPPSLARRYMLPLQPALVKLK